MCTHTLLTFASVQFRMADNALNLCGHHIEMRQFFYAHTKKYIAVTVDKVTQNESLRYGNINTISGIAEFYNDV